MFVLRQKRRWHVKIPSVILVNIDEAHIWGNGSSKIVVIPITGMLKDEELEDLPEFARQNTSASRIEQYVMRIMSDPSVQGVLLRINSPGGGAAASEHIAVMLKSLRTIKKIPICAFIENLGASGAYYVACSADHIIAAPAALVGSIGVRISVFEIHEALSKLGIKVHEPSTGAFKGVGSPFRPFQEQDREYIQELIQYIHEQFVKFVQENRRARIEKRKPALDVAKLREIADGRIFTAPKAYEHGLIDQIGYYSDAMEVIRTAVIQKVGGDVVFVEYQRKNPLDFLKQLFPFPLPFRSFSVSQELMSTFSSLVPLHHKGLLYLWTP